MARLVIRIRADFDRSPLALASHIGLNIVDIPQVKIVSQEQSDRERAARAVHSSAMKYFLSTNEQHCVVLEDDAILIEERDWIEFTNYDFFIPFGHNRKHLDPDLSIREGKLPKYGAFAYLCSRVFAERYDQLLQLDGLADVVSHTAARGLRFASYLGHAVNHDNDAPSLISEERRLKFLEKFPDQKDKSLFKRLLRL